MNEFFICTSFIFVGAFLEAYIIGGITAEQMKKDDERLQNSRNFEYICFSMEVHNFPDSMRIAIIQYI